jgi:tetratricopeptide (TPR) repeat protein
VIEALLQAERLLMYGMADQAERIYTATLEQDPLNAIAVVGLARVALERGDDQLAYARARRALEIDPQNAAAIRLEQRLADVFAARGEPVDAAPSPATMQPAVPLPQAVAPQPEIRPSEQAVFTRNPSMAEHQRIEQHRIGQQRESAPAESETAPPKADERRTGLFRRIFRD